MAVPGGTPKPPTGPRPPLGGPGGANPGKGGPLPPLPGEGTGNPGGITTGIGTGYGVGGKGKPPTPGPGGVSGGHPPVGGGGSTDPLGALTGDQRNAYSALVMIFNQYGLGSLAPNILKYVQQGFNSDTITLLLQDTDAYKQRFAGNQQRLKNGYAVLSPAEYIATENAYRQSMRAAGLPAGFYDSPSDFSSFIGNDVSASEMNNRVQLASQATLTASPQYTQALKEMGLSHGDLTAYFLDPTRALPILQQQAATAAIGSEAIVRGLTFDQGYAKQLAQAGFSQSQAAQGYGQIANEFGRLGQAAGQFGVHYGFTTEEQAIFQPGAGAAGQNAALLRQSLEGFNAAQTAGHVGGAAAGLARHGGGQLA